MFRVEIRQQEVFGYERPVFGWSCPLCPFHLSAEVSKQYVSNNARTHLVEVHNTQFSWLVTAVVTED